MSRHSRDTDRFLGAATGPGKRSLPPPGRAGAPHRMGEEGVELRTRIHLTFLRPCTSGSSSQDEATGLTYSLCSDRTVRISNGNPYDTNCDNRSVLVQFSLAYRVTIGNSTSWFGGTSREYKTDAGCGNSSTYLTSPWVRPRPLAPPAYTGSASGCGPAPPSSASRRAVTPTLRPHVLPLQPVAAGSHLEPTLVGKSPEGSTHEETRSWRLLGGATAVAFAFSSLLLVAPPADAHTCSGGRYRSFTANDGVARAQITFYPRCDTGIAA